MRTMACILAALAFCLALGSVQAGKFHYGTTITIPGVKGAYIRSYVELASAWKRGKAAKSIGVEISKAFLANIEKLPRHQMTIPPPTNFKLDSYETVLDMPTHRDARAANSFAKVRFGFNKGGHPGVGIYDVDHIDMHFDFDNQTVWNTIFPATGPYGPCEGVDPKSYYDTFTPIPTQCFPPVSTQIGDFVFGHGSHLYPLGAPEFNPPRHFNQTLIWGTWGGQIRFLEPMFTTAFASGKELAKAKNGLWYPTGAPAEFPDNRWVASRYGYWWTPGAQTLKVELRSLYRATAGCVYNPKIGYSNWRPAYGAPGSIPVSFDPATSPCKFPTPETWGKTK